MTGLGCVFCLGELVLVKKWPRTSGVMIIPGCNEETSNLSSSEVATPGGSRGFGTKRTNYLKLRATDTPNSEWIYYQIIINVKV